MLQIPCRLAVALLTAFLFAQPLASRETPAPAQDISLAARLGFELALTASTTMPSPHSEPSTPVPHKDKLIFIDAGHGGRDVGAIHTTASGEVDITEAAANLSIALKLADMLRAAGYDVALARSTDSFVIPSASTPVELQKRVDMANEAGADLYICIHNNGIEAPSVRGTEVWYCSDRAFGGENARLAGLVQQALLRNLRAAGYETVNRGIKDDRPMGHFAVIGPHFARTSQMPGIIGESLFLTNDQDAAALKEESIQEAIARGYLEGIEAYFE